MTTARLEAFSDGVIAVAITLLVFDLAVPPAGHGDLGHRLGVQWPHYAAYAVSFLTIGIIWINHHVTIARARAVDHGLLVRNLLLLMVVVVLPWTTSLMAEYLQASSGEHLAAAVYAGSLLAMALTFFSLQRHLLFGRSGLLAEEHRGAAREINRRNLLGLGPYAVAVAIAPVSSYATLAICGAVAVYYAVPQRTTPGPAPSPPPG